MECPDCGNYIDGNLLGYYNTEDNYVEERIGTCPNCHKKYIWESIYIFSKTRIIEECP